MEFLTGLIQFVLALVALILIHEFGHFLAAKFFKVEVEEFGIGFPPRVATLFQWKETKFTLNALPLGGFVRPKGENDPSVEGGLAAANPWVRLVVLFAGPAMNLLLGVILYAVIFMNVGVPDYDRVMIADIAENSPAHEAGLVPGDVILEIEGADVKSTTDLQEAVQSSLGTPIDIAYEREGEVQHVELTPRVNPPEGEGAIGILMSNPINQEANFFEALPAGGYAVVQHSRALLELPFRMIQGTISPEEGRVVGFVGMFNIFQEAREGEPTVGISPLLGVLSFVTSITISLGLLNLVPFPALDGGRILFTLPEIILRKRIPPQYENVINLIGFGLLLLLMIYINLQDIFSPPTLTR
ncbi:MAG: RIP metalloprotease [Chloroflexi bacterium]|nr:MAG: RIP metalloprotease [Chloroflexota bacterium]